jgi:hypothetical protein
MRSIVVVLVLVFGTQLAGAGKLDGYHRLVDRLGVSRDDATAAFAVFMVGCYVGYSGAEVPKDYQVKALIAQVRPHADAMFAQVGANRQQVFEFMATNGAKFLATRAQRHDARALRAEVEQVIAAAKIDPQSLVDGMQKLLASDAVQFPKLPISGEEPPKEPAFEKMEPPEDAPAASSKQVVGVLSWYEQSFDGEYISYDEISWLLLKSGWAVSPSAALDPEGLDAHRAKNPKRWVKWRKLRAVYQLDYGKGWFTVNADIGSASVSPALKKGFRFAGSFKSTSGGSVGDTHSLRYKFWRFDANGRFETSSAGTVTSKSSVGGRASKDVGGRYEIDGVVLTLRYDDGTVKHATIVISDSSTRPKMITINGTMFQ